MKTYDKNIAVCTTVLQAFIKSSSIVVQPDSQSGISHYIYSFIYCLFAYMILDIMFFCVWCILGCKNIEMHVSESVLLWCMRCFFRSIVNRFPGLSNAFVVGVTLV